MTTVAVVAQRVSGVSYHGVECLLKSPVRLCRVELLEACRSLKGPMSVVCLIKFSKQTQRNTREKNGRGRRGYRRAREELASQQDARVPKLVQRNT